MSDVIAEAVKALNEKLEGGFDGSARFVIENEGTVIVDSQGARAADEPAEVTLTADAETFRDILAGQLDPTSAFMSGRLSVDGDMGQAMRLAGALA